MGCGDGDVEPINTGPREAPRVEGVPDWVYEEDAPGQTVDYVGVNLSGAEFGEDNLPGMRDGNYTYPTPEEAEYFVGKGMNVFRLPFRWERLQRTLEGDFDSGELTALRTIVSAAKREGADIILDPHNYARYGEDIIGSDEVPNEAFADFWSRLADQFVDDDKIIFGLMNEPSQLGDNGTENWLESANAAIAAIRETGAEQLILVPGNGWTGGHSWSSDYYGTPNADVMGDIEDPGDNFAFEIHQYMDENSSGTGSDCASETVGVERLEEVTEWARAGGFQLFLGEFGTPPTETCLRAVDNLLTYLGENDDVWIGWTWWAAGPWWGDYEYSIEPTTGDRPQMAVLERHLD